MKAPIRFDGFELDPVRRLLTRDGTPVRLTAKAFDVLLVLASHDGVVRKESLMQAVWPNVAVEENNLTVAVAAIRRALRDSARSPRYILTRPGLGYEFIGQHLLRGRDEPEAHSPEPATIAAAPAADVHGTRAVAFIAFAATLLIGVIAGAVSGARPMAVRAERPLPRNIQREMVSGYNAMYRRTAAGNQEAIDAFRRASTLLPEPATWAALAEAYYAEGVFQFGVRPPIQAFTDAQTYVAKVLRVDPEDPHGLWLDAALRFYLDRDWPEADRLFQRAFARDPNNPAARRTFAWLLLTLGDVDRAEEQVRLAQQLDPGSANTNTVLGLFLYCRGEADAALDQLSGTERLQPGYVRHVLEQGRISSARGDYDAALARLAAARERMGDDAEVLGSLGYVYGRMGRHEEARAVLDALRVKAGKGYVSPFQSGLVHLGMGDTARAAADFQRAVDDRSFWLPWLRCDRRLDDVAAFRDRTMRILALPSALEEGVGRVHGEGGL